MKILNVHLYVYDYIVHRVNSLMKTSKIGREGKIMVINVLERTQKLYTVMPQC